MVRIAYRTPTGERVSTDWDEETQLVTVRTYGRDGGTRTVKVTFGVMEEAILVNKLREVEGR